MSDLISKEQAIESLKRAEALVRAFGYHNVIETIRELPTIEAEPRWIPIKTRPMTAEEKADWEERTGETLVDEFADYFDCSMPEDGQEILISYNGRVSVDTCQIDEYGIGLESNGDWYGISAWMPLPEPYKEVEECAI